MLLRNGPNQRERVQCFTAQSCSRERMTDDTDARRD